ncbi:MAG: diaminopimelate epimerase [Rhodospirillaceae bacterium]|nr:diaminopimelate epimerase [Rhodospirillaceae bacterium]
MVPFIKMHGLGNDFVVLDARMRPLALTESQILSLADRRRGVGFDQLVLIEKPQTAGAAARIRFFNSDGSEAGTCGNGTRCLAALLMDETNTNQILLETLSGMHSAQRGTSGLVTVDMGPANLDWAGIPLSEAIDSLHLPVSEGNLSDPVGVGIGNPHCVFFVEDAEAVPLEKIGPEIEHHALFPERTNVEIASPNGENRFRLRVWERGSGITDACGTGACATAVAAHRRGLSGRSVTLDLDGGYLDIEWRKKDDHVLMTGPVATSFTGSVAL